MNLGKALKIKKEFILIVSTYILVLAGFFLFRGDQAGLVYGVTEPNSSVNTPTKNDNLESTKWSWIYTNDKKQVTWTAEQAFEDATRYAEGDKARQLEALKMYQRVLDARQREIDRYRRVAIRSLITKQYISGFPPEAYLERLKLLKQERSDDKLYQEILDAKIQEVSKTLAESHSEYDDVLLEGQKGGGTPLK